MNAGDFCRSWTGGRWGLRGRGLPRGLAMILWRQVWVGPWSPSHMTPSDGPLDLAILCWALFLFSKSPGVVSDG